MAGFDYTKFRPGMYGVTYIGLGSLAFFLPTHDWYEYIIRGIFILLGLFLLAFVGRKNITTNLLVVGISLLSFWIFFAMVSIATHWGNPFYRIHLFYLPLWLIFLLEHYNVIREINNG